MEEKQPEPFVVKDSPPHVGGHKIVTLNGALLYVLDKYEVNWFDPLYERVMAIKTLRYWILEQSYIMRLPTTGEHQHYSHQYPEKGDNPAFVVLNVGSWLAERRGGCTVDEALEGMFMPAFEPSPYNLFDALGKQLAYKEKCNIVTALPWPEMSYVTAVRELDLLVLSPTHELSIKHNANINITSRNKLDYFLATAGVLLDTTMYRVGAYVPALHDENREPLLSLVDMWQTGYVEMTLRQHVITPTKITDNGNLKWLEVDKPYPFTRYHMWVGMPMYHFMTLVSRVGWQMPTAINVCNYGALSMGEDDLYRGMSQAAKAHARDSLKTSMMMASLAWSKESTVFPPETLKALAVDGKPRVTVFTHRVTDFCRLVPAYT